MRILTNGISMRLKLDTKNSVKKKLDFAIQGKVKRSRYERLKKVISDGGYRGDDLKHLIKNQFSIDFEVRTKDVEAMKSFITRSVDKYRQSYDRRASEYPRQCIFIGTTNDYEFLADKTGNRR